MNPVTMHRPNFSRRGFCLCCMAASTFAATGRWLTPAEAYAEARDIVDTIRNYAATAPSSSTSCGGMSLSLKGLVAISLFCQVPTVSYSSTRESLRLARRFWKRLAALAVSLSNT